MFKYILIALIFLTIPLFANGTLNSTKIVETNVSNITLQDKYNHIEKMVDITNKKLLHLEEEKELLMKYINWIIGIFVSIFIPGVIYFLIKIHKIESGHVAHFNLMDQQVTIKMNDLEKIYKSTDDNEETFIQHVKIGVKKDIINEYKENMQLVSSIYFSYIKHYIQECACNNKEEVLIQMCEAEKRKIINLLETDFIPNSIDIEDDHFGGQA